MGLQSQLSDCWSESIPILAVAIIASFVGYLRSLAFNIFIQRPTVQPEMIDDEDDGFMKSISSGLAGLILLTDQLQLNRICSRPYSSATDRDCVFCLSTIKKGENVRTLSCCRHLFHKLCFDAWLETFNFSCPLCRSTIIPEGSLEIAQNRVARDINAFFTIRP